MRQFTAVLAVILLCLAIGEPIPTDQVGPLSETEMAAIVGGQAPPGCTEVYSGCNADATWPWEYASCLADLICCTTGVGC